MSIDDWIGSTGVAILLLAFILNTYAAWTVNTLRYQGLNFLGAAIAGYASWRISFMPFVVLECIWAGIALATMLVLLKKKYREQPGQV